MPAVTWRGLTLGDGTQFTVADIDGWENRPSARYDKRPRAQGHGQHRTAVWSDERIVTVEGSCSSREQRDELLQRLGWVSAYTDTDTTEPLTVELAGRTLTAGGQLIEARPKVAREHWGPGFFGWLLQWRCPDPLRYGGTDSGESALPLSGGGLVYPLTYPLDYGSDDITGRVTVTNPGTAPAPLLIAILGGLPQGWIASAGSRVLAYPVAVPSGQTVVVNSADGTVLVEGTASRRGNLTRADWLVCPAADPVTGAPGTVDVQFTSLGGTRDPDALMTVSATAAYW